MVIAAMKPSDWPVVECIYVEGLQTRTATFETSSPGWESWDNSHLKSCRLVAMMGDEIAGWAALSPVSDRCVYGGVAEVSVYIGNAWHGKGIGSKLLDQLIVDSEESGIWTLQASMFEENSASVRLHQKLGFRLIGRREKIGKLDSVWKDTLMMERRSKSII